MSTSCEQSKHVDEPRSHYVCLVTRDAIASVPTRTLSVCRLSTERSGRDQECTLGRVNFLPRESIHECARYRGTRGFRAVTIWGGLRLVS